MLSNAGKYRDRNPDVTAAGKCFTLGDTASQCLNIPKPPTPENLQKFKSTTQPSMGQERVFYGRYNDPDIASLLGHGVDTKPSLVARDLANPRPKSLFIQRLHDKKEDLYASKKKAPLGKSHDQREGLPKGIGPFDVCYGVKVFRDCTAGQLVSPAKSQKQVKQESAKGLELYKMSHSAYDVGEMYDRKYDWSRVPKTSSFGVETPHDIRGTNTRKAMNWLHKTQSDKAAPIVTNRVDGFRERSQPEVGKVHDPIKETMYARISPDHTYGVLIESDEYGAGDLIHGRAPGSYLGGKDRERGILAAVRQNLKKSNYHNFHDLSAAFRFYDKDGSGKIDIHELRDVCIQFNLPIEKELLEALFDYCDVDNDGKMDYVEFSNFLNWKDRMPNCVNKKESAANESEVKDGLGTGSEENKETPEVLHKQIDKAIAVDFLTSSQLIKATVGGVQTKDWKTHGVPTVRSDLPAPRIRRIHDSTNYGDESDAYGLMNPSIYSNHGVHERDFFKTRDENEIRQIFDSVGFAMTNDTFQELWQTARDRNDNGEVTVESFRQIIDETLETLADQDLKESENAKTASNERPNIYRKIDSMHGKNKETLKNSKVLLAN